MLEFPGTKNNIERLLEIQAVCNDLWPVMNNKIDSLSKLLVIEVIIDEDED